MAKSSTRSIRVSFRSRAILACTAGDSGPSASICDGAEQSALLAPMPGTVIRVLAQQGDRVAHRQPLLVLEAMKMETPLVSPYDAVVKAVHVAEGDRVAGGALLVELEE
jgi:pyruvate carboxylase